MSNRIVKYARFHTALYVPNVGDLGFFLPASKSLQDLEMIAKDGCLSITFTQSLVKKEIKIPDANIVVMELEPEAKKSK